MKLMYSNDHYEIYYQSEENRYIVIETATNDIIKTTREPIKEIIQDVDFLQKRFTNQQQEELGQLRLSL